MDSSDVFRITLTFPGSDNNPALELPRVAGVPCSFVTVTLNPFCSCDGKDSGNAIRRLNAAINEEMGMPNCGRGEWSARAAGCHFDHIDEIADTVRDTLRTQLAQRH